MEKEGKLSLNSHSYPFSSGALDLLHKFELLQVLWIAIMTNETWKVVPSQTHSEQSDLKQFNPVALRKAKTIYSFGLSKCNRVNQDLHHQSSR